MNIILTRVASIVAIGILSLSALPAFAQGPTGGVGGGGNPTGGVPGGTNPGANTETGVDSCGSASGGLVNPLKGICSFSDFLKAILKGVVQIGTIILTMMLVYVGFLFVVAQGNPEKLQGAKSALVWTVIGGLVLLGATTIQLVIEGTVRSIT